MRPEAVALIDADRTSTYGELAALVWRTAGYLSALGVRRGDRIGLCLKDDWQHVVALLAVARLGAAFAQIDWRSRPAEKARIAETFDFKLVLTLPGADIEANCPSAALDSGWHQRVAAADPPTFVPDDWHDPIAILASSGTTGLPKFTVATHLQYYFRLANYREVMPSGTPRRYLSMLSMSFSASRVAFLSHLLHGDALIFYPAMFLAAEFVEAVSRNEATVAYIVPSAVRQLLAIAEMEKPLLPGLDVLLTAGAPLFPDEKREIFRKLTPNFHEIYGATAIGPMSVLRPQDVTTRPESVGRPFPLVDIEIVDDHERPVPVGETGRLRCRGPALTSPIPGNAAEDDFRDGWHYPGELAALDESGYLHLHGRTSEVIFRGGAKIFPTEIEVVLQAHESVAEAAVVARASSDNEQELVAYVIAGAAVTPGQLLALCRRRLTPYKVPREIHIVSQLPRNPSGKLDKHALTSRSAATLSTKM
jgi:acyl-coenzyme A synthetase/AMP-(fatty) acid ligase